MAAKQMKTVADHLTCPVCYDCTSSPNTFHVITNGVQQLPNNFFINRLLDEVALRCVVEGEEEAKCDQCTRNDL